MILSQICA